MVLEAHSSRCVGIERTHIIVATRYFVGYKYLIRLCDDNHLIVLFTFSLDFRVLLSYSLLANNGGQERHQTRSLSLQRGESIARRCQNSTTGTI
jgi:hypothetical protein